jgi:hypothetical protein
VQEEPRLDAASVAVAVDRHLDLVRGVHAGTPSARRAALASARSVSTATR